MKNVRLLLLLLPALLHAQAPKLKDVINSLPFREIGPANPGGRIDDFAVVESDPRIIYAGTASGGVLKTTNGGVTWTPITDTLATSSVGDLAIAPSDPSILYAGMGEANNRQSSSWGDGVYKTTDAGKTWTHLGLAETHHIGRILVHPTNPDIVYVAAAGHLWGPNKERGVYKSTDGGKTWTLSLFLNEDTGAIDLAMDPQSPGTIYAAMYQRRRSAWGFNGGGPHSGLYKTTDGGAHWRKLTQGLPETGETGRIGVNVYAKNPSIVYAIVENAKGGVFRSEDKGETWVKMSDTNPRPMYYSQIHIDPTNDQRIWVLGAQMFYSEDGGKTFRSDLVDKVHADHHALWINPANSDHMVLGCDGGINFSHDRGKTWDLVNNFSLAQYYEVGFDMAKPYRICGGLQDNGSWCGPSATLYRVGITNEDWVKVFGADGFYAQIDPRDPNTVFVEGQDGNLVRRNLKTSEVRSIRPEPKPGQSRYRFNWNSPVALSHHNPNVVYYGGNHLFKSTDRGDSWTPLGGDLTTNTDRNKLALMGRTPDREMRSPNDGVQSYGNITTLAESPVAPNVIWAGTDDGNLQVTKNGGESWKNVVTKIPGLPKGTYVSRVVASRSAEGTAYAAFDGHRMDDYKPHLFVTTDYGETWKSIATGLPQDKGSVHVVREHFRNPDLLFVGTEYGLYCSIDRGTTWTRMESNLPRVPVYDIAIHPRENDLIVGTHGRGIWLIDDITPLEQLSAKTMSSELYVFPPRAATSWRIFEHKGVTGHKLMVAQNPPYGATIQYYLKAALAKDQKAKVSVLDAAGKVIWESDGPGQTGIHRVTWDLRYPPPYVPAPDAPRFGLGGGAPRGPLAGPGKYEVKVVAGSASSSTTVTIEEDPRIEISNDDRSVRMLSMLDVYDMQKEAENTRKTVVQHRTQLTALIEAWKKPGAVKVEPSIQSSAEAVLKKVQELASKFVPPARGLGDAGPGLAFVPPTIPQRLGRLMMAMDGYTAKPTAADLEELADTKKTLVSTRSALEALGADIAGLNRQMSGAGVPYVATSGSN